MKGSLLILAAAVTGSGLFLLFAVLLTVGNIYSNHKALKQ